MLPMVQRLEAAAAAAAKLFYLILSRITSSRGSKIHPDTQSEIKIKMLLSSRFTIYHETSLVFSTLGVLYS